MAETSVAKARAASASKEKAQAKPADIVQVPGVSRREFLYYAWGASLAILLAQSGGLLIWFGLPRFQEGEFGGVFVLDSGALPERGAAPADNAEGKFWLSNAENGVVALYKVCTHLGCLYRWVAVNGRFECPCHGSMFDTSGMWIQGPATRSLDRFEMTITTNTGEAITSNIDGDPIPVAAADIREIRVNTGARIKRAGRV